MTAPRLLSGADAAAYCGVAPATFSKWVAEGTVPKPLPGTRRWDRKAIDLALDKASGIPSVPMQEEDRGLTLAEWRVQNEARKAARERDPERIRKKAASEAALAKRRGLRRGPY
jgi:predicted DNA-binding transcriptional regulator AlpA